MYSQMHTSWHRGLLRETVENSYFSAGEVELQNSLLSFIFLAK